MQEECLHDLRTQRATECRGRNCLRHSKLRASLFWWRRWVAACQAPKYSMIVSISFAEFHLKIHLCNAWWHGNFEDSKPEQNVGEVFSNLGTDKWTFVQRDTCSCFWACAENNTLFCRRAVFLQHTAIWEVVVCENNQFQAFYFFKMTKVEKFWINCRAFPEERLVSMLSLLQTEGSLHCICFAVANPLWFSFGWHLDHKSSLSSSLSCGFLMLFTLALFNSRFCSGKPSNS